jgi:UDP-glucuronate 4-epimerase
MQSRNTAAIVLGFAIIFACSTIRTFWSCGRCDKEFSTWQIVHSNSSALSHSIGFLGLTAAESCRPKKAGAKSILLTGTGGFIGYHTAKALAERGDGVLGLDNFNQYYPTGLKRARAAELERVGVFTLGADLNDGEAVRKAMELCKFTHVLHLAAQAGVRYATKDPHSYVASNVAGMVVLLEAAKDQKPPPRIVYASSSSVYGLNTKVPFSEQDIVDRPASLYAATKKADEMIAHTYNHVYNLALTGLRFFTVYGPHGRPDMAAFAFANKIMKGETLKVFQGPGGSELERDFTYIDDIVSGCVGALDHIGPSSKPAPYKLYNLGNRNPVKVSEFVDILEEHLGKKAIRKYIPLPATGDVLKTHADISLAMAEIGYGPKTSLREGLKKFVEWYKAYYKNGLDAEMSAYQPL